jgi:formylglycine-generating enzyme required for sulfatase activity
MRASHVDVRWQESADRSLTLDVQEGASQSFAPSFGDGDVPRISLSTDLARADIVLTPHPPWADRFWRDGSGLWAETTVRGFEWVAESLEDLHARLKGLSSQGVPSTALGEAAALTPRRTLIEPRQLRTQLLWPTWAKRLDKDDYGLFAEVELADSVVTRLRWIPPGRFLMGSPEDEKGRRREEGPQHWVTLTEGYWLADAPCTQAEWRAVMGTESSHFKGEDLPEDQRSKPVANVTWDDCQQFCERLRARFPGLEARLPSEAEWEYACRAGTASAFNNGSPCIEPDGKDPALAKLGCFKENCGGETQAVRGFAPPNQWGLYDMHGNVQEWCSDEFRRYTTDDRSDPKGPATEHRRVIRGGSCGSSAECCRSGYRGRSRPFGRYYMVGFRLASGQSGQVSRPSEERADGKQARRRQPLPGGERAVKKAKGQK